MSLASRHGLDITVMPHETNLGHELSREEL